MHASDHATCDSVIPNHVFIHRMPMTQWKGQIIAGDDILTDRSDKQACAFTFTGLVRRAYRLASITDRWRNTIYSSVTPPFPLCSLSLVI